MECLDKLKSDIWIWTDNHMERGCFHIYPLR